MTVKSFRSKSVLPDGNCNNYSQRKSHPQLDTCDGSPPYIFHNPSHTADGTRGWAELEKSSFYRTCTSLPKSGSSTTATATNLNVQIFNIHTQMKTKICINIRYVPFQAAMWRCSPGMEIHSDDRTRTGSSDLLHQPPAQPAATSFHQR